MFWPRASTLFAVALAGCAPEAVKQSAPERAEADAAIVSELAGVATIVDADTIRIGPRRIRFDGILTPRQGAMCGDVNLSRAAADALRELSGFAEVTCRISDIPDAGPRYRAMPRRRCRYPGAHGRTRHGARLARAERRHLRR